VPSPAATACCGCTTAACSRSPAPILPTEEAFACHPPLAPLQSFPWLRFAWLNTLRNRRRSAVTVTIAALGTAAMLLAGGFALFTYESLAQASARTTGHLIVGHASPVRAGRGHAPAARPGRRYAALKDRLLADERGAPGAAAGGVHRPDQQRRQVGGDGRRRHRARRGVRREGPFLTVGAGQVLTSDSAAR
jgi:putative ABC transport system permease protein